MAQRFYHKASVQTAIVSGVVLLLVTIITIMHQRSNLSQENHRLTELTEEQSKEIQRLETLLTPFRTIALERYTAPEAEALQKLAEQINHLQSSDEMKSQRIKELENQLRLISEKASPPTLTLYSKSVESKPEGLVCTVRFNSSKNTSLGTIQFIARLPADSEASIKDIWPSRKGGVFETGPDSKLIAEDGKSARLLYHLVSAVLPVIEITLSGPSKVTISGNYLPKPEIIEIE